MHFSIITRVFHIHIEVAFNKVSASSMAEVPEGKNLDAETCLWVNHVLTSKVASADVTWALVTRPVNRTSTSRSHFCFGHFLRSNLEKIRAEEVTVSRCVKLIILERTLGIVKKWASSHELGVKADTTELVLYIRRNKYQGLEFCLLDCQR